MITVLNVVIPALCAAGQEGVQTKHNCLWQLDQDERHSVECGCTCLCCLAGQKGVPSIREALASLETNTVKPPTTAEEQEKLFQ
eukprot:1160136-Pelagomonas_calceolata.AAC.4